MELIASLDTTIVIDTTIFSPKDSTTSPNNIPMEDSLELEKLDLKHITTNLKSLKGALKNKKPLKIICYGNSITFGFKVGSAAGVDHPYPIVLEGLLQKEFDHPNLQVINEGHNGWRSDQALANLRTLVIQEKPDWVILMLGINDAYSGFPPKYYLRYMSQIVDMLQAAQIQVLLMNPTPILTEFNGKVLEYSPLLHKMAQEKNFAFFNLYQSVLDKKSKSSLSWNQILPDEIHFADDQYAWIAEAVFEFLLLV